MGRKKEKKKEKEKEVETPERQRRRPRPSRSVQQMEGESVEDTTSPTELTTDIHYSCKTCGWSFSLSRNKKCPMCKEKPKLDMKFLINLLVDFCAQKAYPIRPKDAKIVLSKYKKEYKKFPSINELWVLSHKVVQKTIEKKFGKEAAKKMDETDIDKKFKKRGAAKEDRKKAIEQRRKAKDIKATVENEQAKGEVKEEETIRCIYCGAPNPIDSSFCVKCGKNL